MPTADQSYGAQDITRAVVSRIQSAGSPDAERMALVVDRLHDLFARLKPTEAEFAGLVSFLTDVGHHSDERRQEWVLLADVLGLSALAGCIGRNGSAGSTPQTMAGPFYRPDAPDYRLGANISLDRVGEPLRVSGNVVDESRSGIGGAMVEIWHANQDGVFENQEPDRQPDLNLRGRFETDAAGRFHFLTVRPGGYSLPSDGPVGRLFTRLGLRLRRPAHLSFRVSAPGYDTVVTEFFDRDDPAIGDDALYNAQPGLLTQFVPAQGPHKWETDICVVLQAQDGSRSPHAAHISETRRRVSNDRHQWLSSPDA